VQIQKSKIFSQRWSAFVFAGVAVFLFVLHIGADNWILALVGVGFFLGITDFGRQCPLLLSVHHLLARMRKKG
jgi:1,4-dihydroxy-2-naphthoate octaprenyltransferase